MFWFSVQGLPENFIVLSRIQRNIIINVYMYLCEVLINLVRIYWSLNFLAGFSRNPHISNFVTFCAVGVVLLHVKWHMDIHDGATYTYNITRSYTTHMKEIYYFKYDQQDATLYNILYYCQCSTCFRRFLRPSSGAQKLHTQHRVCQACLLLPLAAAASKLGVHDAVCAVFELLMMGGETAWNM